MAVSNELIRNILTLSVNICHLIVLFGINAFRVNCYLLLSAGRIVWKSSNFL